MNNLVIILLFCTNLLVNIVPIESIKGKYSFEGYETEITDLPYHVAILYHSSYLCSGAIIHEKAILTAAGCISSTPNYGLYIRAGSARLQQGGYTISVKSVHNHPNFNTISGDYDVSVMVLAESLQFTAEIKQIMLPAVLEDTSINTASIISGWGVFYQTNTDYENLLKMTPVNLVHNGDCQKVYGNQFKPSRMICFDTEKNHDSCLVEIGGPLATKNEKLIGIASSGYNCNNPKYPRICSKVAAYREFIDQILLSI